METISFAGEGLAPDLLPLEELADCAATALEADGKRILSYGAGGGYTPLRELVAERFEVHPHRVLLTNGWLQGFSLLVGGRVTGQNILVEYPTYDRALRLLFSGGGNMLYVDWTEEGLALDILDTHIRTSQKPALCYTAPTFHNPTGQTLDYDERYRMCRSLLRSSILVVEDDAYGPLRFEGEAQPTLFDLTGQQTVYSTSLSLPAAPGLRVGVFILPDDLSSELAAKANDIYITPALLGQATVFEFISRGSYDPHVLQLAERLKERRDLLIAALEKHVEHGRWTVPEGGIFLLLRMPPGTNAKAQLQQTEGVEALAGADFNGLPNSIRLNFAEPALDEIEPGVERLAEALAKELDPEADPVW
jgi:DNA-binding transcriptional MocR family regulator